MTSTTRRGDEAPFGNAMVVGWIRGTAPATGAVVEIVDHRLDGVVRKLPALVLGPATRDAYMAQQRASGRLEHELAQSCSIVNTATRFYYMSVD